MENIYIVKIEHKYFNKILRYHIYINKIIKNKDHYLLFLDKENYEKLIRFKKIYKIELIGYKGLIKYIYLLKRHFLFFSMFILSLIYIIFLSNIIFKVEVKTLNVELKELIVSELKKNNIDLYKFCKSFSEKEMIKNKILNDNKDKLEWLEITREGTKYIVNVEERIINKVDDDNSPRDIIASKNAIILSIDAKRGSIVKKLNDYVKKGDIIVTGTITHKDSVVDLVHADATIYGETWYNVHVSYPIAYYEKTLTGNNKKRLSLTFLNKKINFFEKVKYKDEAIEEIKILYHKFLPIKISLEKVNEIVLIDDLYTTEEAIDKAIEVAREKILKTLPSDSKILLEKKLKIIVNNSTIDIDVFFKVYENITAVKEIVKEGE